MRFQVWLGASDTFFCDFEIHDAACLRGRHAKTEHLRAIEAIEHSTSTHRVGIPIVDID